MYQIIVKGIDGRSKCLQHSHPDITAAHLKTKVYHAFGIPQHLQLLVTGTLDLSHANNTILSVADGCLLFPSVTLLFPSVTLLLRLRGGRGGRGVRPSYVTRRKKVAAYARRMANRRDANGRVIPRRKPFVPNQGILDIIRNSSVFTRTQTSRGPVDKPEIAPESLKPEDFTVEEKVFPVLGSLRFKPLTVISPTDKIVKRAIRLVLDHIYQMEVISKLPIPKRDNFPFGKKN